MNEFAFGIGTLLGCAVGGLVTAGLYAMHHSARKLPVDRGELLGWFFAGTITVLICTLIAPK
jgi:hypothetical protein